MLAIGTEVRVMMLVLALAAFYLLFLLWWGGRGKPLSPDELREFTAELQRRQVEPAIQSELLQLASNDDGREFVMQNLARYRARAHYPPGHDWGDDPRAADRRYGRAIIWPLLRQGSLPIFIARRVGSFIEPEGSEAWHYVAMVRYRSRRDFLKFALAIDRDDIVVHKWAALEKTHVFPVRPLVSLFMVRLMVGMLLILVWLALKGLFA